MSERGSSEAVQIKIGLEENDASPWEFGVYIERCDDGDWIPLVYGEREDYEDARQHWLRDADMAAQHPEKWRNPRIVRRAVSPWEVVQ